MTNYIKFMKSIALSLFIGSLVETSSLAECVVPLKFDASNVKVSIAASVWYRPETNDFLYSYQASLKPDSPKKLGEFAVRIGSDISKSTSPGGWDGMAYQKLPLWSWSANDDKDLLSAGSAINQLTLTSDGLPEIQQYYAQSDFPIPNVDEIPENVSEGEFASAIDILNNSDKGYTISPGNVSIHSNPLRLVALLKEQTMDAEKRSWITRAEFSSSLNPKIDSASISISHGSNALACSQLGAYQTELKKQTGKQVNPEAASMLAAITRAIIFNLKK